MVIGKDHIPEDRANIWGVGLSPTKNLRPKGKNISCLPQTHNGTFYNLAIQIRSCWNDFAFLFRKRIHYVSHGWDDAFSNQFRIKNLSDNDVKLRSLHNLKKDERRVSKNVL